MRTVCLALVLCGCLHGDFFVSTKGSDSNPGTRQKPFRTLERARDALRAAGPSKAATVWLRGGTYRLTKTFQLEAEDSGSAGHPVVYRAVAGETVRLTGGQPVAGWRRWKGSIKRADLRKQGITDFGKIVSRGFSRPLHPAGLELFAGGRPMPLAHWPNHGWAYIGAGMPPKSKDRFAYDSSRPERWKNAPDVWVHGYWTYDWADTYEHVASIDTTAKMILTDAPHGVYGYKPGQRWMALNLLEELDEPGEWYLDRATGMLYFWPPAGAREPFVSLLETPLIAMRQASHIELRDFSFEYSRGDGIHITGGSGNLIARCRIMNLGNRGIVIEGGSNSGVEDTEIAYTGEGGLSLAGGDRRTLTAARHFARRNHIHHYGYWSRTYTPAIYLQGVGQQVSGNTIDHAPHNAILLGGNEHRVEANDIHTVAMETGDVGAYYLGRDWTERGNAVIGNYFHNLGHGDVNAVYLDDCASGTIIRGNVIERAHRGVMIGGGRDNLIEANRFVDCDIAIHMDARGLGWAKFWFDGRDNTLFDRLDAMPYRQEPWRSRYPQLLTLTHNEPAMPKGNTVDDNWIWGPGKFVAYYDHLTHWDLRQSGNHISPQTVAVDPAWVKGMGLAIQTAVIEARLERTGATEAVLTITNRGRSSESGVYDIWAYPEEAATLDGPRAVPYTLHPGEQKQVKLDIAHSRPVWLGAEPRGEGYNPAGIPLK